MARKPENEILRYPIGKQTTTIKGIMKTLGILDGASLTTALHMGRITVDGQLAEKTNHRVSPGQSVVYGNLEIQVYLDEEAKRRRLMQTFMTSGTSYGNTVGKAGGMGNFKR